MTDSELMVRRACAWCGIDYMAHRSDSRYCTEAHRQQAYRWRKRLTALEVDAVDSIEGIASYIKYADSKERAHRALYRIIALAQQKQFNAKGAKPE
jgi:hypothetical protein